MRKTVEVCLKRWVATTVLLIAGLFSLAGCEDVETSTQAGDAVQEGHRALTWEGVEYNVFVDDSAAPVHVAITVCESVDAAMEHSSLRRKP